MNIYDVKACDRKTSSCVPFLANVTRLAMSTTLDDAQTPRIILVSPAPSISEPELTQLESNDVMTTTVTILDGDQEDTVTHSHAPLTPSAIAPQMIEDILMLRPTLVIGRPMTRERAQTAAAAFRRRRSSTFFKSVQHRQSRPHTTGAKVRRSSSLPMLGLPSSSSSSVTIEDISEEPEIEDDANPFDEGNIRRSTRRIKDRLRTYRQTHMTPPKEVRQSFIADFRYVKWPKIKSQLQVIRSWELWKGHIKQVEGHFGTAVVSYFIFLRWLFIMNVIIFALWFGFVIIPNSFYVAVFQPPNIPSTLSCSYDPSLLPTPNYTCIEDLTSNSSNASFYLISGNGYSCNATNNTFSVRSCLFETQTIEGVAVGVAFRESTSIIMASSSMPTDCQNTTNVSVMLQTVRLCSMDIQPHVEWYQYVIDFFLGEGIFNDTVLFHGRYSDDTQFVYNFPLAFMLMIIVVYAISIILLVYNLGKAYNENYLQFGKKRNVNFCNKVFSAWDFNITNDNTAILKKAQIKTDFSEELADWQERHSRRTNKELAKVIVIRIFTNLFTILLLAGGAVAIFYAAQLSFTTQSTNGTVALEGLVSPVVITAFNIILPFIFSFLAKYERFKTQSGEIKMTLFRTILVRLASLIVLIITLYIVIQCTQNVENILSTASGGLSDNPCGLSSINISSFLSSFTTSSECPVCWETYIGQEFYKLALTNFILTSASTIGAETGRNIISCIRWKGIGEKIGKGNFNIPKSILDLVYTQALLWLGFIFTPLSPVIILATTFLLFYVKKYSLIWNLAPSNRKTFRAARTNFAFIALMLLTLFMVIIVIGFAIASLRPSSNCGPFRGRTYMYSIIPDLIAVIENCSARAALEYFGSFGFIIPVFILLVLIIYAQQVTIRARKKRFNLVKKQLLLEGANVTHIVGTLDEVLNRMNRQETEIIAPEEQDSLKTRMEKARRASACNAEIVSQF